MVELKNINSIYHLNNGVKSLRWLRDVQNSADVAKRQLPMRLTLATADRHSGRLWQ